MGGEDWIVYSNSISRTKPKTLGSLNLPGGYTKGDTIYSVKDMGTTTDYPVKRGMQGTVKGPAPSTCDDPTEKLNVRFESEGGTVQGEDWIVYSNSISRTKPKKLANDKIQHAPVAKPSSEPSRQECNDCDAMIPISHFDTKWGRHA